MRSDFITTSVSFTGKAFENLENMRERSAIIKSDKLPRSRVLNELLEGNPEMISLLQKTANKEEGK